MTLPEAAIPFNENAREYDKWYDTPPLFDIEVEAIHAFSIQFIQPGLEVGVGPGRFAQALNIEFGLDPALSPLQLARHRSIIVINGIGEQLPVRTQSIGTVYLFFTLCFLTDPVAVFKEFFRVLKPEGLMVIGFIPRLSSWGKLLTKKGKENHPYYRFAHFQTVAETKAMLTAHRLKVVEAWSTLFQPPGQRLEHEHPRPGASEEAGFCVLMARK
jgi:ubiquinone/menaquinone biosynthesis C-methylase UbiE